MDIMMIYKTVIELIELIASIAIDNYRNNNLEMNSKSTNNGNSNREYILIDSTVIQTIVIDKKTIVIEKRQ